MLATPSAHPVHFNPWLSMWLHPGATIQQIVDTNPLRWVFLLALLAGVGSGLNDWLIAVVNDYDNFQESLPLAVAYSLALGTGGALLFCLVLHWICGLFWEKTPYSHLVSAHFWSRLPYIAYLGLFVCLAGVATFVPGIGLALDLFALLGGLVSVIWSLAVWLGAAAQVMRCSVGAAFGRGLLAGVILIIPMYILYSVASYFF